MIVDACSILTGSLCTCAPPIPDRRSAHAATSPSRTCSASPPLAASPAGGTPKGFVRGLVRVLEIEVNNLYREFAGRSEGEWWGWPLPHRAPSPQVSAHDPRSGHPNR